MCFDLSKNKTLRTLETTAESIVNAKDRAPEFLNAVLSSIASPGILDVVVIYRDCDFGGWGHCPCCRPDPICSCNTISRALVYFPVPLRVLCKMHRARKSLRLVFCADVYGCFVDTGVRMLTSAVEEAAANGQFEHFACRPVIVCEGRSVRTRLDDSRVGMAGGGVPASAL